MIDLSELTKDDWVRIYEQLESDNHLSEEGHTALHEMMCLDHLGE